MLNAAIQCPLIDSMMLNAVLINFLFTGFPGINCTSTDWLNCASEITDCRAVCEGDISAQKCTVCLSQDSYKECGRCVHQIAPPNSGLKALGIL